MPLNAKFSGGLDWLVLMRTYADYNGKLIDGAMQVEEVVIVRAWTHLEACSAAFGTRNIGSCWEIKEVVAA